ncbi:uncharacterized protein LOC125712958 [Brienomyrus brachyistius]|uniref:uncharacterized protein LOC125712958 n=1 Tax=Brienomyrus brachyistius TaxID=42636 RepID=UPI0020B39F5B|nr:uncharacterized protein LOC125712958 [Brienomyrus brachyistius]
MASSVVQAVSGIWRSHSALEESDGPDNTPEAPQRSYSSSSLRSLRSSLRTRLPLRPMESQASAPPTLELAPHPGHKLRLLTRSARNSIGGAYQKLQRRCSARDEFLVASPGQTPEDEENEGPALRCDRAHCTARRPSAAITPTRNKPCTPQSAGRKTCGGKVPGVTLRAGGSRRQLVRVAALKSPFASPNTLSRRRQFDMDLESVSAGLRRLKNLSLALDDVIGRDERAQAIENYHRVMVGGYKAARGHPPRRLTRASIRCKTKRIQEIVHSWTDVAVSKIRKAT